MNDTGSLQDLFTNGVINILMDLIMLVGIIVILFSLSPILTLAVMIILPLMFFITTKLRRNIRQFLAGRENHPIETKFPFK